MPLYLRHFAHLIHWVCRQTFESFECFHILRDLNTSMTLYCSPNTSSRRLASSFRRSSWSDDDHAAIACYIFQHINLILLYHFPIICPTFLRRRFLCKFSSCHFYLTPMLQSMGFSKWNTWLICTQDYVTCQFTHHSHPPARFTASFTRICWYYIIRIFYRLSVTPVKVSKIFQKFWFPLHSCS